MAVTSRDLKSSATHRATRMFNPPAAAAPGARRANLGTLAHGLSLVLIVVLLNLILTPLLAWGRVKLDDLRYGRPRTMQTTAFVGHDETNGQPSHFVAMNLERRVVILHMPGGDASKTRTITGPYLFGAGEDLTPVLLRFEDVNADKRLDMLVNVKQEEMVYINDQADNSFRLATAEELGQIQHATP
jgi:hypothetical protein